jgi:DNA-directed RNA polymerase specialized sigma24 family protein
MLSEEQVDLEGFESFMKDLGSHLRDSLGAMFGVDVGREATAEALAYGWENWDRIRSMENPIGYLFVVGRNHARREFRRRPVVLAEVAVERTPWVEPGLPTALASLSQRQRTVVMLLHSYGWTMAEVADLMGISKGAVQTHERRGMRRLRSRLGVT